MPQQRRTPQRRKPPRGIVLDHIKRQRGRFSETTLRVPSDVAVILSMVVMAMHEGAPIVAGLVVLAFIVSMLFQVDGKK